MNKRLFYILFFSLCFFLIGNGAVLAVDGRQELLKGLGTTAERANFSEKNGNAPATLPLLIGQIISITLSLLGVIFLVLIIYSGNLWMNSAGNDEEITKAKNIMVSAVIGLFIIFAAYAITLRFAGIFAEKAGLKEAAPAGAK